VSNRYAGAIIQRIEAGGFALRGMRLVRLTRAEAEGFYAVHRDRPFFDSLTTFMSSGPAVVLALEAADAIRRWRDLMGATDPAEAEPGSLRREFGESIERNATHGSDAPETAAVELGYFFRGVDLG
jgi:nucleoside-diphosphate kinase